MKKICLITTTRADFGIIKNLIHKLKENKKFKIKIIAGGSHFLKSFGKTISERLINLLHYHCENGTSRDSRPITRTKMRLARIYFLGYLRCCHH